MIVQKTIESYNNMEPNCFPDGPPKHKTENKDM